MRTPLFASVLLLLSGCPASTSVDAGADVPSAEPDVPAALDTGVEPDAGAPDAPDIDAPRSDAPLLSPVDAGDPFGDTGTLGAPAWVDLDVLTGGETCPPLVPCGGDEVGTWDVTGGCIELPLGGMLAVCPGATLDASGRARGRVVFDGTIARRIAQTEVVATLFLPAVCAGFVGGCAGIEERIRMQSPDTACVEDGAGNCDCAVRQIGGIDDGDLYTIEGNEIVSSTAGRRWEYCVEGTSLRYRDVTPTGEREPGIIELGRVL
jgi:hypothetical protein